jgi:hypothetical protein
VVGRPRQPYQYKPWFSSDIVRVLTVLAFRVRSRPEASLAAPNFVSINPYWAGTFLPFKGMEVSLRLHYLFNPRNDRPTNTPMGMLADSAQAGQAVWANFAASYEIVDGLHVGVNGYYLKQITADKYHLADGTTTDGVKVGEGKEQVLGLGPGAMWDLGEQKNILFANLYFQALVQARAPSTVINVRWLHTF